MERISRFSFLAFLIVFLEMSPVGSSAAEVTSTTSPQQLVQSTGSGPSFDCAAARSVDERLICSDQALGEADGALAKVFREYRDSLDSSHREEVIRGQRAWIVNRNQACGIAHNTVVNGLNRSQLVDCLLHQYQARTNELATLANAGAKQAVQPSPPSTPTPTTQPQSPSPNQSTSGSESNPSLQNPIPATAQTRNENVVQCNNSDPDLGISGCTALIQSGQESTANLAVAYNNRGNAYNAKGLYDQAISDFNQAIALTPDDAVAYNGRGLAYYYKKLYDQAIADHTKAITLKPDYAVAYYNRGNAYYSKGLRDQAIADLRAALNLNPQMKEAQDGMKLLGASPQTTAQNTPSGQDAKQTDTNFWVGAVALIVMLAVVIVASVIIMRKYGKVIKGIRARTTLTDFFKKIVPEALRAWTTLKDFYKKIAPEVIRAWVILADFYKKTPRPKLAFGAGLLAGLVIVLGIVWHFSRSGGELGGQAQSDLLEQCERALATQIHSRIPSQVCIDDISFDKKSNGSVDYSDISGHAYVPERSGSFSLNAGFYFGCRVATNGAVLLNHMGQPGNSADYSPNPKCIAVY